MGEWIRRMKSNIALALSAAGVVISLAGLIYRGRWLPHIASLCVVGALFLLFACPAAGRLLRRFCRPRRSIFVSEQRANEMLGVAIRPRRFPPCQSEYLTHATGVAALAMAATDLYTGLVHLHQRLDVRMGEIAIEAFFDRNVLAEHLAPLRRLWAHVYGLRNCLATECFRLLPDADLVYQELVSLQNVLEQDVIRGLDDLLQEIPPQAEPGPALDQWQKNLDTRLRKEILPRLYRVYSSPDKLPRAIQTAESIVATVRQDWQWDMDEVWQNGLCRPQPGDAPQLSRRISEFILSGANGG